MENENSPRGKRNPSFQADEFDLKDLPGIQFSLSKKALSYPLVDSNYTKAVHYHPFRVDFSKVFHLIPRYESYFCGNTLSQHVPFLRIRIISIYNSI